MSLLSPNLIFAQFYNGSQLSFGKNRVQYEGFLWTFYQFEDFDVYFYRNGKELALFTARYAESQIDEIERKLESTLDQKIQFLVFNKLSELKQSNLGLMNDEQYNVGGITHIIGHKVFIYFDGEIENLQKQINAGIARVILEQTLYGGSVGSQIKNSTMMNLPEWYVNGIISYVSEDWNTEIDNYVRDGILSDRFRRFNSLSGQDATLAGHSIWNYIADKYGNSVVSNIIYMSKISRNIESGFLYVLGISFKNLMKEWLDYYEMRYLDEMKDKDGPPGKMVLKKFKDDYVYYNLKISPDGRYLAYVRNEIGKYKLYLLDTETSKTRKISKGGYKLDEKNDLSFPLIAWHPSSKLIAYITETKGGLLLHFYTPEDGRTESRNLINFDKILDFSYAPSGRSFVFSAVRKGQSDLFLFDIASNSFVNLTDDIYDDLHPRYFGDKKLLFSSNRLSDTIKKTDPLKIEALAARNDIFMLDISSASKVLKRISHTPLHNETYPMSYGNGYISYLSDQNGIYNRYLARFDSLISYVDTTTHYRYYTESFPVSNYKYSILEHDISPLSGKYAEIVFSEGRYFMYIDELATPVNDLAVEHKNTSFLSSLKADTVKASKRKLTEIIKKPEKRRKRFANVYQPDLDPKGDIKERVDINNYQFDRQSFIQISTNKDSLVPKGFKPLKDAYGGNAFVVPKQRNYNVEYSINELVSQLDFDYLNTTYQPFTGGGAPIYLNPGINAFLKVGVTDLLEDYRITGGARLSVDLNNNEYIFSFSNLKGQLDKEITFHRKSYEETGTSSLIRHYTHELIYLLKWPFSPVFAAKGSAIARYDRASYLSTDEYNLKEPDLNTYWGGFKGELVYDATRTAGLNIYFGPRFLIFAEYYQQFNRSNENLAVLGMDFRHYLPIHRTFIWANRFAASASFGNNKLIYYMGGVDNWITASFNDDIPIDYSQNYAYQTLATPVRGFDQNIRNGSNFFVINSELRFPVFRYFFNRPIRSDFLNNFQIVGFGDVGTAWNGLNPYSSENSLFTTTISQQPLLITVEMQKEPIVGGFGFGLRSRLLGYFVRADLAWGVEDYQVQPSKFYISLSLDF